MTARQLWEAMLTELSKVNAPSMLLQDFNYFLNKAINQYINKRYNIYDVNQQTTDDLRVLKGSAFLKPKQMLKDSQYDYLKKYKIGNVDMFGATYEVNLPDDYFHILNCMCIYHVIKTFKCYDAGTYQRFAAKRLTADSWSTISEDYYQRPLPWRPYYYIHNVNTNITEGYNSQLTPTNTDTDLTKEYKVEKNGTGLIIQSNLPRTIALNSEFHDKTTANAVEREIAQRYGNPSKVRMEIRYGADTSVFELDAVQIDYLKTPQYIRLTQEQVNLTEDTSQILEFPDYVCQEIVNELTLLVMENVADPRLQTNPAVTQSIAQPAQQQAQPQSRS